MAKVKISLLVYKNYIKPKACEQLGEKDKITVLHPIGGRNGSFIENVLQEMGIHQICIAVEKETRTCTTVLDVTCSLFIS